MFLFVVVDIPPTAVLGLDNFVKYIPVKTWNSLHARFGLVTFKLLCYVRLSTYTTFKSFGH